MDTEEGSALPEEARAVEFPSVAEEGEGMRPLVSMAAYFGISIPEFFDPITGDYRERIQDVRGDDCFIIPRDKDSVMATMVAYAPLMLEDCRRKFIEAEESRRELYGKYRDFREALRTLVDACKYCELLTTSDTLEEAEALLNEHGVETWSGDE